MYTPKYVREVLNYQAGESVKHGDYNRNLNLLNVAVDNNTEALKNLLLTGDFAVLNSLSLDGAVLQRYRDVTLQDDDEAVPSSKAVYAYVNDLVDLVNENVTDLGVVVGSNLTEINNIKLREQVTSSLIEQLFVGVKGVHIGPDAPTDDAVDVWIDTDDTWTPWPYDDRYVRSDHLPALSVLENDMLFITSADIPTALSAFTNDMNYVVDANYVHTSNDFGNIYKAKLLGIEAEANKYVLETHGSDKHSVAYLTAETDPVYNSEKAMLALKTDLPTALSELENDTDFITSDDIPTIPTATSQLTNNSGYITIEDLPEAPVYPTKLSDLENDGVFITAADIPATPNSTSDLINDSGFITSADIPAVNYTLPTATDTVLGGVKIGDRLTITDSVLSADEITIVDTYADLADLDSGITKAIVRQDTLADRTYTTLDGSTEYEMLYVNPLPPLYGETYEDTYLLSTGAGGTGTMQGQVEASEDDGFRLWTLQLSGIYLGAVALAIQQNYIGGPFEIAFNGKTCLRLSGGWIDNLAYVDTATDEVSDITMYDKKPDTIASFLTCYITPVSNDATNWHRIKYALQPTPFEINYSGVYEKIDDTWALVVKNDKLVNGNIGLPLPS